MKCNNGRERENGNKTDQGKIIKTSRNPLTEKKKSESKGKGKEK